MTDNELQNEINSITQQIVIKYQPQKIILFGSAAWGTFTPDSDLDFLIIKKETPSLGRDRMRQLYCMINKNIAADFLVYRPDEFEKGIIEGDPFLKEINQKGKVLYG